MPHNPYTKLVFGIALILLSPAMLHAESCPKAPETQIVVEPIFDDTRIITTESMIKIKKRAEVAPDDSHGERWPVGLSAGTLVVRIDSQIQTIKNAREGSLCSSLKTLRVGVGFTDNRIYVARELPRRSCPYREVLAHEQKHKTVDKVLANEMLDDAKDFFEQAVKGIGVVYQKSAVPSNTVFDDPLNEAMHEYSQRMMEERQKRQRQVDSEEEYDRIGKSCDGQLAEIINERVALIRDTEESANPTTGAHASATTPSGRGTDKQDDTQKTGSENPPEAQDDGSSQAVPASETSKDTPTDATPTYSVH